MTEDILSRPAYTLTAGELIDLLVDRLNVAPKKKDTPIEKRFVHSLGELATILGCSVTTVNVKKQKGVFGDAIKQRGRMLQIDVDLAAERFWNSKKK